MPVLSQKGWVVIPKKLRERYGLKKGDRVHVIDYGGVISIVPGSKNPIENALAVLRGKPTLTGELTGSRREDANREK